MSPSESHAIVEAALGWFHLGNCTEVFNELESLSPIRRASVEAMELRCRIYRKLEKWKELELVAEGSFSGSESKLIFGCQWAWALLKQGKAEEAESVLDNIPVTCAPEMLFTRACVLCAKGDAESARGVLADAIAFSIDADAMKLRALGEPELDSLWRA